MSQIVCIHRWEKPNEYVPSDDIEGMTATQIRNYLKLKDEKLLITTPLYRKQLEPDTIPLAEYKQLVFTEGKTLNKYPPADFNLTILPDINPNTNSLTFAIKTQLTETVFPNMTIEYNPNSCKTVQDLVGLAEKLFNIGCKDPKFIKTENDDQTTLESNYTVSEMLDSAINQIKSGLESTIFTFECNIPDDTIKNISKRCCLSSEVISSEESFVADLFQLNQVYEKEIKKSKIFDNIQFKFIFGEIPGIVNTHKKLLGDLKQIQVNYASEFGPVFLNFVDNFKVSLSFISKYKKVDEMIKQKLLRPDAEAKFKEIEDANESGKTFMSYYITPVQRYPRYPLLIRDLIKCTPDFHPDKHYLTKALHEIDNANKRLDETSHKIKQLVEIEDIEKETHHCIAEDGREFIMKKTVKITKPKNQTGILYLFNDIVFLAIKTKKGQQIIFGSDIEFIDASNFQFCNDRPTPDSITAFIFQKEYIITFESYSEKAVWMEAFNKVRVNQLSIITETKNFAKWTDLEIGEQIYPLTGHDGVMFKNKVYFVGGLNQSNSNNQNVIIYDIENDRWSSEPATGLPPRSFHTCGTYKDYIYAFFGQGSRNPLGDIWRTQGGEWTKVPAPTTNQRYGHSIVFYNDLFYIFGGRNGEKLLNDVLIFNPEKNDIKTVEPAKGSKVPSGRYYHSASIYNDKMIIYGGKTLKGISSDIYSFNITTNEWKRLHDMQLKPRYGHRSVILSNNYLFAIGGFQKNGVPANTVVVSLTEVKLFTNFAEFGNVPFCISKFALVPLTDNRALTFGGVDANSKFPFSSSYIIDTEEGFDENREIVDPEKVNKKLRTSKERKKISIDAISMSIEQSKSIQHSKTAMTISTPVPHEDDSNVNQAKKLVPKPRSETEIKKDENMRNTINTTDDFVSELAKRQHAFELRRKGSIFKDAEEANSSPDLTQFESKSQYGIKTPNPPLPHKRKNTFVPSTVDDEELSEIKKMNTNSGDGRKRANTINTTSTNADEQSYTSENNEYKTDETEASESNEGEKIIETEEPEETGKIIETEDEDEKEKIVETDENDEAEKIEEADETEKQEPEKSKESEKSKEKEQSKESEKSKEPEKAEEQGEPEEKVESLSREMKIAESSKKRHPTFTPVPSSSPLVAVSSNLEPNHSQINRSYSAQRSQSAIFKAPIDIDSNFVPDPNLKLSSTFNENEFCRKFAIDVSQLSPIHHQQMLMKMRNAFKLILENEGYENQIKSLNQKGSLVLKISDESKRTHILFFSEDDKYDEILQKVSQVLGKEISADQLSIQLPNEPATEFSEQSFEEKKEKLINEKLSYLKLSEN